MRSRAFLPAAAVAVSCAGLAVTLPLARRGNGPEAALHVKRGVPLEASMEQLQAFVDSRDQIVYWAGSVPSRRLELTETRRGTFVRYLPAAAKTGTRGSLYLTVATYPLPGAFGVASRVARRSGAVDRPLPGKGIAVWHSARPTSVYVAHAGSDRLVEVYAPQARRARSLVLSGRIRPISGG